VLFLPLIVYVVNQGGDEENDDRTPEPTTGSVIGMSDPSSGTEVTTTRTPEPTAAPTEERRRGGDNQRDLNGPAGNSDAANSDIASNELGYIPVLEYHAFTNDPAAEEQFTRLFDDFFVDLQWLYDHDFYVIPLTDFVRNDIEAPAGKHPVVLTFDDSTSSQFLFIRDDNGELVPDPNSAVGMMEAFFAAHPDFGRGGFFAILPFNCFSIPNHEDQTELCDQKLAWLIDHGYEVGNHTMGHTNLGDIDDETFRSEIGGAIQWMNEHAPGHHGQMLVIPYGRYPDRDLHPEQRDMLENGFQYDGEDYRIEAAFMVGADPSPSPSSTLWDPIYIPRIQAFDEELARWLPRMESGEVILYTSDGNPDTISVPDPLPPLLEGEFDPDRIAEGNKTLIQDDSGASSVFPRSGMPPAEADPAGRSHAKHLGHDSDIQTPYRPDLGFTAPAAAGPMRRSPALPTVAPAPSASPPDLLRGGCRVRPTSRPAPPRRRPARPSCSACTRWCT